MDGTETVETKKTKNIVDYGKANQETILAYGTNKQELEVVDLKKAIARLSGKLVKANFNQK